MSAWLRSRERRPPRVALVAAMKTEAAYLADWVHHHLYFGFDPIEIHVNRSDDGTEELARAIARVEPRLSVFNVDHFDRQFGPQANVQTLALREARHRLKRDLERADYLCFLDADEFWTPVDFRSSIQDVLGDADHPRIAAFNWFNRIGDHPAFGPPFPDRVRLRPHRMVKTCFRARTYA
ncbi:MAG: glycosyltransferase family 2 protein, partial [Pseudomonadota bacterium]